MTARELWGQVPSRNANNELAYIGIGKNHLQQAITAGTDAEDYLGAMQYFRLGNDRKGYSQRVLPLCRASCGRGGSAWIINTLFAAAILIYLGLPDSR